MRPMDLTPAELRDYRQKYWTNKGNAKKRGVAWRLTFEEWLCLWSEHILERGVHRDQYVLCRKNDQGAYAFGNCYVARSQHNNSVRGYKETRTHAEREWYRPNRQRLHEEETETRGYDQLRGENYRKARKTSGILVWRAPDLK